MGLDRLMAEGWANHGLNQNQTKPNQTVLHGFGFGLRILEPKPAKTKPKPWFENQTKPEHH
jgi:hypothetical protein